MIALMIDMEISNEAHLFDEYIATEFGVIVFMVISVVYLVGQQYILFYSSKKPFQIQVESLAFQRIKKLINYMILFMVTCFITIIIQILVSGYYNSLFLLSVLVITNFINIVAMGNMSLKFLLWFKTKRHSTILMFGVMSSIIALTAFASILFMGTVLLDQPQIIDPNHNVVLPTIQKGSVLQMLNYVYYYLAIISYVITWTVTSLLLNDYARKLGKLKFWAILALPLIFYLSQLLITQVGLFVPKEASDSFTFQMWFSFLYTLSSPIGGILFCIPFYLIIKKTNTSKPLRNFLSITAYGLVLFFAAGSATVYHTPYPPFGLSTVAIIGPSSYLIAVGIYFSARIIARNRSVENQLKNSDRYSQFFANIGSAEMETAMTEIIEHVRKKLPINKEELPEDIESMDKEIIEYLKKYQEQKNTEKKEKK